MKTCGCGNSFPSTIRIDGVRRNLSNRTRCFTCVPFGISRYRTKSKDENISQTRLKQKRHYEKYREKNGVDPVRHRRMRYKAAIVALVGSKCQFCGYERLICNLAFHHLHDKKLRLSEREFQFSAEVVVAELMKCVVTCHNCHGEIHKGMISNNVVETAHREFYDKLQQFVGLTWAEITGDSSEKHQKDCSGTSRQ